MLELEVERCSKKCFTVLHFVLGAGESPWLIGTVSPPTFWLASIVL